MLKIAIIGTGSIAKTHAKAITECALTHLACFVGTNIQKTQETAQCFNAKAYSDIHTMMAQCDPGAILIAVPSYLHAEIANIAIDYKKHILCEKPFTLSVKQAQDISVRAKKAGVQIMVMQVARFFSQYEYIKQCVENGLLGQIKNIYTCRMSAYPNWTQWHKDPAKSGGGLYDLAIHDIDYLYSIFGMVKSVYATGKKSDTGCFDNIVAVLNFENDTAATCECNMDMTGQYPFTDIVRINGQKACVEYINIGDEQKYNKLTLYNQNLPPQSILCEDKDPYLKQIEHFSECILQNKPSDKISVENCIQVLQIIESIADFLQKR